MLVSELMSAFYGSLASFGPTRIVTQQQALAYLNMALAQVWSYDGRAWSWAFFQERFIPAPRPGHARVHGHDPIPGL